MAGEAEIIAQGGNEIANGPPANEPEQETVVELGEDELKNAGVDAPEGGAEAGGEKEPPAKEPAAEERPKPKRKDRAAERVAVATAEAARLRDENERLKQRMGALEERVVTTDHAALDHYESATKAELEAAKRDLVAARTSNDPEKEAEAQERLATAAAKKAQIDTFRAANPRPDPKTAQPRAEQPRQERQREEAAPELPSEAQTWIANTGWFNPDSDDFDEDMHDEARDFARSLERRLIRRGRSAEIGRSKDYFKAIEDHVAAEFPDKFEPPAERKPPQMSRPKAPVAGVGSGAAAPGAAPAGKTKVRLSPDERKMAHNLADSGAITKPGGARMTHAEAETHFAIQKIKTAKPAA